MIVKPFLVSITGCLADYVTTVKGLSIGFVEQHVDYTPLNALMIFTLVNLILCVSLPRSRWFNLAWLVLSALPFLGALNNICVMFL